MRCLVPRNQFPTLAVVLLVAITRAASAADENSTAEADAAIRFQERARKAVSEYVVRDSSPAGSRLSRHDEPLLRWSNPLGGQRAHGELYLWTDRGRPAAVISLYELTREGGAVVEHHEWSSLTPSGLSVIGPVRWEPKQGGVEPKVIIGAPPLAESKRVRLNQMRKIAADFSAEKTTRSDEVRSLRLLTQPLYRYESLEPGNADGALFAFVEATDPEAFLMLETRVSNNQLVWHYSLARMTNVRLAISLGKNIIWEVPTLPWSEAVDRADLPYSAFRVR